MAGLCVAGVFPGEDHRGGGVRLVAEEGGRMDQWLLKFVGENWMTLYLITTVLKGIALMTPSVTDDKIVTLIGNAYGVLRRGKAPDSV